MATTLPPVNLALVQTADRNTNQLQANVGQALKTLHKNLSANPLLNTTILPKVSLTTGLNTIQHGLGQAPQGWWLVRKRGPVSPVLALTDWTAYTPTGSWTANTTYSGLYRRVGDSLQAQVKVTLTGAPTSTSLNVSIPSGLTIDVSKLVLNGNIPLGLAYSVVSNGVAGLVSLASSTSVVVFYDVTVSGSNPVIVQQGTVNATSPQTFGNGSDVTLFFQVPIVGWSEAGTSFGEVYDAQDTNNSPDTTLLLIASAPITVDIAVF